MEIKCPLCSKPLTVPDGADSMRCWHCGQRFQPDMLAGTHSVDDLLALAGSPDETFEPGGAGEAVFAFDDDEPGSTEETAPKPRTQPVRRPGELKIPAGEPGDLYGVAETVSDVDGAAAVAMPSATGALAPEMEWVVWLNAGAGVLFWLGAALLVYIGMSGYDVGVPMVVACLFGLTLGWIGKILWSSSSLLREADPA